MPHASPNRALLPVVEDADVEEDVHATLEADYETQMRRVDA